MTEADVRRMKEEVVCLALETFLATALRSYDRYLMAGSLESIGLGHIPEALVLSFEEIDQMALFEELAPQNGSNAKRGAS